MEALNEEFPVGIYLPIWESSTNHYCICKLVPEESKLLKSRERCPYILCFEVIEATESASSNVLHLAASNLSSALIEHASKNETTSKLEPSSEIYASK